LISKFGSWVIAVLLAVWLIVSWLSGNLRFKVFRSRRSRAIAAMSAILLASALAHGQGTLMQLPPLTTSLGQPIAGATISVFTTTGNLPNLVCASPVTVFKDVALSIPFTTLTTDGAGNYPFFIQPTANPYGLIVSGAGTATSQCYGFSAPIPPTGSPTFTNLTVTGALTASCPKNLGGVQYACNYVVGSTTCGVQEAYNALPATGGKIVLQLGNCSAAGWPVNIQKPVVIEGQGMGGPNDPGTNANVVAGSSLTNTSTGNSFFVISLGAGTSLEGVTFKDFAMIGNKAVGGATAGDCVDVNGGGVSQQVRAISFQNLQCNQPKGSGFVIKDNAFMINFLNVHVDQSGSHCYVLKDGVNSGVNSQIHFLQSTGDLCGGNNASSNPGTADGWNISGSTSRTLDIIASTLADSNNGINVVVGAINTNVHVTNSDFETNTTCDISLNDGFGHVIIGSTIFGTTVGARGICTAMPAGAAVQPNQLLMFGNNINGHTVQDVTIGANQKTGFILPQSANNYSYSDASGHVVKMDVNQFGALSITAGEVTPAASGTTLSGDPAAPWSTVNTFAASLSEFTAPSGTSGKDICYGDSTAHAMECSYNNGVFFRIPQVIGSGAAAMTTAGITTGACGTTVTVAATGVLTTDTINTARNAAATIGNGGGLTLNAWPTAGNVNFNYCNSAAGTITPTAMTINWNVTR
jgi:hypothetical protein